MEGDPGKRGLVPRKKLIASRFLRIPGFIWFITVLRGSFGFLFGGKVEGSFGVGQGLAIVKARFWIVEDRFFSF